MAWGPSIQTSFDLCLVGPQGKGGHGRHSLWVPLFCLMESRGRLRQTPFWDCPQDHLVPLHHPLNYSKPPFSARCIWSMTKSTVSKSSKMHTGVLLKTKLFHKQQNFRHFTAQLLSMWLLLSQTSSLQWSLSFVCLSFLEVMVSTFRN